MADMQEYFRELRKTRQTKYPWNSRGITLERIETIVKAIGINDPNCAAAILALLDDDLPNYYKSAREVGRTFSEGASTAQIGCHVGILQRGGTKLDREGRDYWIKPLREIGAIEAAYCDPQTGEILPGHLKAKSPNNCYRLDAEFIEILATQDWRKPLTNYLNKTEVGKRLKLQARGASIAAERVSSDHADLIRACIEIYVPAFLPTYKLVYIDDGDGDRITDVQREDLQALNIELTLADSFPDVILVDTNRRSIWFIEAVTSDGEVDEQKVKGCIRIAKRAKLSVAGFTTAYSNWKSAAMRQSRMKNVAPRTYIWILEDAGRQFFVEA